MSVLVSPPLISKESQEEKMGFEPSPPPPQPTSFHEVAMLLASPKPKPKPGKPPNFQIFMGDSVAKPVVVDRNERDPPAKPQGKRAPIGVWKVLSVCVFEAVWI